ncbi:phage protein [Staphylococcus aureus subsp. aureus TW20]|nr:phage protein [Staphylococcus aureus subsp. aureus TW20]
MLHSLSDCTYAVSILHYSMVNCGICKYRNIHVLQRMLFQRIKKLLLVGASNSIKHLRKNSCSI